MVIFPENYSYFLYYTGVASSDFNTTVKKVRDDLKKQLQGCVLQNADEVYKGCPSFTEPFDFAGTGFYCFALKLI